MKPVGLARKTDLYESQTGNEKNSRSASDAMAFRLARPTLRSSFVSLGFSLVFLFLVFRFVVFLFVCSAGFSRFLFDFHGRRRRQGRADMAALLFFFFFFFFCFSFLFYAGNSRHDTFPRWSDVKREKNQRRTEEIEDVIGRRSATNQVKAGVESETKRLTGTGRILGILKKGTDAWQSRPE